MTSSWTSGVFAGRFRRRRSFGLAWARSATTRGRTISRMRAFRMSWTFAPISGWESTAIENHSGIVDNLRNFKSDPAPIAGTLLPMTARGEAAGYLHRRLAQSATFDFFLLNDTERPATGTLVLLGGQPSGQADGTGEIARPSRRRDQFSYLLKEAEFRDCLRLPKRACGGLSFSISVRAASRANKRDLGCTVWTLQLLPAKWVVRSAFGHFFGCSEHFSPLVRAVVTALRSSRRERSTTVIISAAEWRFRGTQKLATRPVLRLSLKPAGEVGAVQTTAGGRIDTAVIEAVKNGTPLLAIPQADTLSDGVAKQLADAGAFTYSGNVGDVRAPWMGNWYFVRKHPVYDGLPVDQAMGIHYQAKGRGRMGCWWSELRAARRWRLLRGTRGIRLA